MYIVILDTRKNNSFPRHAIIILIIIDYQYYMYRPYVRQFTHVRAVIFLPIFSELYYDTRCIELPILRCKPLNGYCGTLVHSYKLKRL